MSTNHLPLIHYVDRFEGNWPANSLCDIDALGYCFITAGPAWADSLMALRDRLVRFVGLKPSVSESASDKSKPSSTHLAAASQAKRSIHPGDQLGPFRVYAKTTDSLLLGADDRHLNFRVILQTAQHPDTSSHATTFSVTTQVQFNNTLGRLYFTLIKPFHKQIVKATVKGMEG